MAHLFGLMKNAHVAPCITCRLPCRACFQVYDLWSNALPTVYITRSSNRFVRAQNIRPHEQHLLLATTALGSRSLRQLAFADSSLSRVAMSCVLCQSSSAEYALKACWRVADLPSCPVCRSQVTSNVRIFFPGEIPAAGVAAVPPPTVPVQEVQEPPFWRSRM